MYKLKTPLLTKTHSKFVMLMTILMITTFWSLLGKYNYEQSPRLTQQPIVITQWIPDLKSYNRAHQHATYEYIVDTNKTMEFQSPRSARVLLEHHNLHKQKVHPEKSHLFPPLSPTNANYPKNLLAFKQQDYLQQMPSKIEHNKSVHQKPDVMYRSRHNVHMNDNGTLVDYSGTNDQIAQSIFEGMQYRNHKINVDQRDKSVMNPRQWFLSKTPRPTRIRTRHPDRSKEDIEREKHRLQYEQLNAALNAYLKEQSLTTTTLPPPILMTMTLSQKATPTPYIPGYIRKQKHH